MEKIQINEKCQLIFLKNDRFKTTRLTFNFFLPLEEEGYCETAILPFFLTSCCDEYKTPEEMSRFLNYIYGAMLSGTAEKVGDNRRVSLSVVALNDKYSLDGTRPMKEAYKLLCSAVFRPSLGEDGLFLEQDFGREKRLFCEMVEAEKNDKRTHARSRLEEEVFRGTPFGLPELGTLPMAEAMTREGVFAAWQKLIKKANLSVTVVGESIPEGFVEYLAAELEKVENNPLSLNKKSLPPEDAQLRQVTDREDITQGKLCIGIKIGAADTPEQRAALTVANDLLGGGTYSKFFTVVRETLHLCYYCSSRINRQKQIMYVDSGVEAENAEKAKEEIFHQLELLKQGDFSDKDLSSSKKTLCNSVKTVEDTASVLDRWYSASALEEQLVSPQKYREIVSNVSREDVIAAAEFFTPHTVYYLMPKEGE